MKKDEFKDKFGTALVNYACPICGAIVDSSVIMNSKLTKKAANEVNNLHNKTVGYSENACEECLKFKDEAVFFIGVDAEKSDKQRGAYRTGHIVGLNKESDFVKNVPAEYILKTANDVKYCFIDIEAGKEIGIFNESLL